MVLQSAVIGLGNVSDHHLDGIERSEHAELTAVCDLVADRVDEISRRYGCTGYTDVERMVEREELDWAHVCTPPQTHLDIARILVRADVDLLIEKPITVTVEEYDQLCTLANENGVRATEVHNMLYYPATLRTYRAIENGEIGTVRGIDLVFGMSASPNEPQPPGVRGDWVLELPGGEFEDEFAHPIYLALRLGGYPQSEDSVSVTPVLNGEYDMDVAYDGFGLSYSSEDDVLCNVQMYSNVPPKRLLRVYGERGTIEADLESDSIFTETENYRERRMGDLAKNADRLLDAGRNVAGTVNRIGTQVLSSKLGDGEYLSPWDRAHAEFIDREAASIVRGLEPVVPERESYWTIRTIELIREGAVADRVEEPVYE